MTRFSVVIPTYQRREIVCRNVAALAARPSATSRRSSSSTARRTAPRRRSRGSTPVSRCGSSSRRTGAGGGGQRRRRGRRRRDPALSSTTTWSADPEMLAEHDRSHREGADLVLGDIPLHPASPREPAQLGRRLLGETPLRAPERAGRGARPRTTCSPGRCRSRARPSSGSAASTPASPASGLFGGEDIDFGYRVLEGGPSGRLQPGRDQPPVLRRRPRRLPAPRPRERPLRAGAGAQAPRAARSSFEEAPAFHTRRSRWLLGPFVAAPEASQRAAARGRRGACPQRPATGPPTAPPLLRRAHARVPARGPFGAQRRLAEPSAVVLAYHAVADLSRDPVLREYGVPAASARRAARRCSPRRGWHLRRPGARAAAPSTGGRAAAARRPLVTFDDAYADLLAAGCRCSPSAASPRSSSPSAATSAAERVDRRLGARRAAPARRRGAARGCAERGVEVGSHCVNHRPLTKVPAEELDGRAARLRGRARGARPAAPAGLRLPPWRVGPRGRRGGRDAGYAAAFTIDPGPAGELRPLRAAANRGAGQRHPVALRLKLATAQLAAGRCAAACCAGAGPEQCREPLAGSAAPGSSQLRSSGGSCRCCGRGPGGASTRCEPGRGDGGHRQLELLAAPGGSDRRRAAPQPARRRGSSSSTTARADGSREQLGAARTSTGLPPAASTSATSWRSTSASCSAGPSSSSPSTSTPSRSTSAGSRSCWRPLSRGAQVSGARLNREYVHPCCWAMRTRRFVERGHSFRSDYRPREAGRDASGDVGEEISAARGAGAPLLRGHRASAARATSAPSSATSSTTTSTRPGSARPPSGPSTSVVAADDPERAWEDALRRYADERRFSPAQAPRPPGSRSADPK